MNEALHDGQLKVLVPPWFLTFHCYDPRPTLFKLPVPAFVLIGSKDPQVDAELDVFAVKKAPRSSGNKAMTVKVLPGLNHLFQLASTGSPSKYLTTETTLDSSFVRIVGDWFDTGRHEIAGPQSQNIRTPRVVI